MRRIALLIFIGMSLVGCTSSDPVDTSAADARRLEEILKSLNLGSPDGDVRAHVAMGDFRPVGLEERNSACKLVGGEGKITEFERAGRRCLHEPQYIPNDPGQKRLLATAETYARAYNDALIKDTNGHYAVRFSADGLTWTVPDRFTTWKDEGVFGKTKNWFLYAFWKDGKFDE